MYYGATIPPLLDKTLSPRRIGFAANLKHTSRFTRGAGYPLGIRGNLSGVRVYKALPTVEDEARLPKVRALYRHHLGAFLTNKL